MTDEMVTRKAVRHAILRARNERVSADQNAAQTPSAVFMHGDTLSELLVDGDPTEAHALDFEGLEFCGIPIVTDQRLEPGLFVLDWPVTKAGA